VGVQEHFYQKIPFLVLAPKTFGRAERHIDDPTTAETPGANVQEIAWGGGVQVIEKCASEQLETTERDK
jgi:hypothetical protein